MVQFVILVPTYNEAAAIVELLRELEALRTGSDYTFDLIVIDDNSPDGTAEIVERLSLPWIKIIRRPRKDGLGEAYRAGFSEVLVNPNYTYVVTMDADGSHRVDDLTQMLVAFNSSNSAKTLVIGTRWMRGGKVVNWPKYRQLLSRFGTRYAKFGLGLDIDDLTGGYRIYSSQLLKSLDLHDVNATGYCFQIQMALASQRAGANIVQIPITFIERNLGRSKMTIGIALEAFGYVTKAAIKRVLTGYIRR
jgi:dolichol-phosphate mannosyltransferase